jgi:hypothetical protein
MSFKYSYETFSADAGDFNKKFTKYLNRKGSEHWRVKHCSYCHGSKDKKMFASCMFERES